MLPKQNTPKPGYKRNSDIRDLFSSPDPDNSLISGLHYIYIYIYMHTLSHLGNEIGDGEFKDCHLSAFHFPQIPLQKSWTQFVFIPQGKVGKTGFFNLGKETHIASGKTRLYFS